VGTTQIDTTNLRKNPAAGYNLRYQFGHYMCFKLGEIPSIMPQQCSKILELGFIWLKAHSDIYE